jgi:TrmH family RNA methyltransferase
MRSCAAFGFNNLAIITPAVDAYDPKTIRSSMGALFHLNLEFFSNFDAYLAKYPRTLFSFQLDESAAKLTDIKTPTEAYALVLGNEATGLPKDFATRYGAKSIFIPQSDQVDSLNLSVATSIALYHFANH